MDSKKQNLSQIIFQIHRADNEYKQILGNLDSSRSNIEYKPFANPVPLIPAKFRNDILQTAG